MKNLNIHKKNYDIDEAISKLFFDVTGIELVKNLCYPTVTCELCVRSLQYFDALKNELVENQLSLLSYHTNTTAREEHEPKIEYRNFSDSDEDSEPQAKKIKLEETEKNDIWISPDPTVSDLLDEIIPLTPDQTCSYCHKKFPTNFALNLHLKKTHSDQVNSQSTLKNISSPKKKKLESSIDCKICGRSFATKDYLKAHEKYHEEPKIKCKNQRKHKCPICDKTYLKNSHLSRHIKVTHEKRTINCNVPNCERVYTRKERVLVHISKQHPELYPNEMEIYIEAIKTTPYNYGIAQSSSTTNNSDEMNNLSDERSMSN